MANKDKVFVGFLISSSSYGSGTVDDDAINVRCGNSQGLRTDAAFSSSEVQKLLLVFTKPSLLPKLECSGNVRRL